METLPGVAPQEQQNTYFYVGQHETKRTVPVTTELGNQAQDAGVSLNLFDTACCQEQQSTNSLPIIVLFILALRSCDLNGCLSRSNSRVSSSHPQSHLN